MENGLAGVQNDAGLRLPASVTARLACPRDAHAPLERRGESFRCTKPDCGLVFPIYDGIPVLIAEERSVFEHADFAVAKKTTMDLREQRERHRTLGEKLRAAVVGAMPSRSLVTTDFDTDDAIAAIEKAIEAPRILVIGAGDAAYAHAAGTLIVYSDVARGSLTGLIADAHDLPFADASFDAYIAVAVFQHLIDPQRAVAEAHRVLRPEAFIYVVAPMIQQNALGRFDFFLYTHSGLRRLLRNFSEVRSGVANGPGMALSWSIEFFFTSFSENRWIRSLLSNGSRLLIWPIKYFDHILSRKAGAYDCASAFYFFGRRSETPVPDRQIIADYRGLKGA